MIASIGSKRSSDLCWYRRWNCFVLKICLAIGLLLAQVLDGLWVQWIQGMEGRNGKKGAGHAGSGSSVRDCGPYGRVGSVSFFIKIVPAARLTNGYAQSGLVETWQLDGAGGELWAVRIRKPQRSFAVWIAHSVCISMSQWLTTRDLGGYKSTSFFASEDWLTTENFGVYKSAR